MPLKIIVTFDTSRIEQSLNNRFGLGSEAQRAWSMIVFDGSAPYMPLNTGRFMQHSEMESIFIADQGEIVYVAPPEYDYPYLPMFLWTGQSLQGTRIIKNYTTSTNAKAGGHWVTRARNDMFPKWREQFQELIDSGKV